MALIRLVLVFSVVAVVCPLVGFDLTHVLLIPLALGAGLVSAGCLVVNAKSVAGPAFAWTCGLVGACVAADIIKAQVNRLFGGANGWLLLAGVVAAGTLALVAQVRGARGAGKANKITTRSRTAVVEPEPADDGAETVRVARPAARGELDRDEDGRAAEEDDELHLFPRRDHGR